MITSARAAVQPDGRKVCILTTGIENRKEIVLCKGETLTIDFNGLGSMIVSWEPDEPEEVPVYNRPHQFDRYESDSGHCRVCDRHQTDTIHEMSGTPDKADLSEPGAGGYLDDQAGLDRDAEKMFKTPDKVDDTGKAGLAATSVSNYPIKHTDEGDEYNP